MKPRIHVEPGPGGEQHRSTLRTAALEALGQVERGDVEITLVLVSDEQIRELNRQFRDTDEVTDVLSFPLGETDPDSGLEYLGDIVISLPQAARQAKAAAHPLSEELALLSIHGVLHLLDYDHADPEAKAEMWAVQNRALQALGSEIEYPDKR